VAERNDKLERELLLDISRLIWRSWSRRLSTGLDRVCLAYLQHFGNRAQAVVQHRGAIRILSVRDSDKLFDMLLDSDTAFRGKLLKLTPRAFAMARGRLDCSGAFYINVGHTDMDIDRLNTWVNKNHLRSIYMVHDLIPLTHSEFCRPRAVTRHRARVISAIRSANGILANSEATVRELQAFAKAERLSMPPIMAAWLAGTKLQPPPNRPMAHHFVYVSTIEGRKNHFMLLQIWRRMAERLGAATPKLVIIGQKGAKASHVEDMMERCEVIRDHIMVLSNCSDEELGRWIGTAIALLFPSFAEGFGLPVVEALQLGTPVIASDLPCFREIGMGIPTLLDPLDAVGWHKAIMSFLENGSERRRQLDLFKNYRPPSWTDHFSKVDAWLNMLRHPPRYAQQRSSAYNLRPRQIKSEWGATALQNDAIR